MKMTGHRWHRSWAVLDAFIAFVLVTLRLCTDRSPAMGRYILLLIVFFGMRAWIHLGLSQRALARGDE